MNIIIEYKSFNQFKEIFYKANVDFKDEVLHFIVVFNSKVSLKPYYFLKKEGFRDSEYIANCNLKLRKLIQLTKRKNKPLCLSLILKKNAKRYISAFKHINSITRVYDISGFDNNYELLKTNKYLLVKDNNHDDIYNADLLNIYVFGKPKYQCVYSSCLCENLYVSKKGIASFCPNKPKESELGDFLNSDDILDNETFNNIVQDAVDKRNKCNNECESYVHCMGGCPIISLSCEKIKSDFKQAQELYNRLKQENDLSKIPYEYADILIREMSHEHKY